MRAKRPSFFSSLGATTSGIVGLPFVGSSSLELLRAPSNVAGQEGLEPPTAGFGDRNSGQLSYCPSDGMAKDHNRQEGECRARSALGSNSRVAEVGVRQT